jgi:1-acyl-sn-glycerol-3-phosphate acyltransferase
MDRNTGFKAWYFKILFKNAKYLPMLLRHIYYTVKLLKKESDYKERYKLAGLNLRKSFRLKINDFAIIGTENIPNDEPVLVVMNHDSNIDPFVVIGATSTLLQGRFVSDADSHGVNKINDKYFESLNVMYMDRKNLKQAYRDSQKIIETLKTDNVLIFPQGQVNLQAPLKDGTFNLAKKANVAILPLKITNSHDVMDYVKYKFNHKKIADVKFEFHPIISKEEVQNSKPSALAARVGKILLNSKKD